MQFIDEGSPAESLASDEDSDPETAALKRSIAQQELNDDEMQRARATSASLSLPVGQQQNARGTAQTRRSVVGNTSDVTELYLYVPEYTVGFMPGMTKFLLNFTDAKDPNLRHIAQAWTRDAMENLPYLLDPLLEDLLGFLLLVSSTHGANKEAAWESGTDRQESYKAKAKLEAVMRKYFENGTLAAMEGREGNFDLRSMLQDVLRGLEKLVSLFKNGDKMGSQLKNFKPSEQLLSGLEIYYGSHFYKSMVQDQLQSKS